MATWGMHSSGTSPPVKPPSVQDRAASQALFKSNFDLSRSYYSNGTSPLRTSSAPMAGDDMARSAYSPRRTARTMERLEREFRQAGIDPAAMPAPAAAAAAAHSPSYYDPPIRAPPMSAMGNGYGHHGDVGTQGGGNEHVAELMDSNIKLHAEISDRDAFIHRLNASSAELEKRIAAMRQEREECNKALAEYRVRLAEVEKRAEQQYSEAQKNQRVLQENLHVAAAEARDRGAELERVQEKLRELGERAGRAEAEADTAKGQVRQTLLERDHWARQAQQLAEELEALRREKLEGAAANDTLVKKTRMEMHELQAQLSAAEVEKSVAVTAKVDLVEDINRLNRRLAEREAEVAKLGRLLEQREQTIAELGPAVKESQRLSRMAKGTWSPKSSGKWQG